MKKIILPILLVAFSFQLFANKADEGMWLPMLLKKYNYEQMKEMGLKLTPEQLYDVNNASLKDAIVSFGGFCTGEVISNEGLVLTNHHCGFSSIQSHSSVDFDFLTNGFWAKSRSQELQNPGLYVSFLVRMEDVTERLNSAESMGAEIQKIESEATEGTHYNAEVKSLFNGGEYYLFVYETFTDVRLVGAPPSSIGKFGGDTDNWMWPRHTGDFSLFRIYAGKDNKPAPYSTDNVPYKPKHSLPVSLKGFQEGDFSMVYGFPGGTDRYMTSFGINWHLNDFNPAVVNVLGSRIEVMKEDMDASDDIRIKLASDHASLSNGWKYYLGQTAGLKKLNLLGYKQEEEAKFKAWVATLPSAEREKYEKVLSNIQKAYGNYREVSTASLYAGQVYAGPYATRLASQYNNFLALLKADTTDEAIAAMAKEMKSGAEAFFKDYSFGTDQKLMAKMLLVYYTSVLPEQQPQFLKDMVGKKDPKEVFDKFAADAYKKSIFVNHLRLTEFLEKPSKKGIEKDPLFDMAMKFREHRAQYGAAAQEFFQTLESNSKLYIEGMREMKKNKKFYPDANSTLRLTYGKVIDYSPRDAVDYGYVTTLEGIMEKEDPSNPEFIVPKRLKELYQKKDFGQYEVNGTVPVAFITDNDITGGNSGSPVINGEGHLIGVAFDGNWEAMTGDLVYDPDFKRCINVDIRYVLFIIDKYAGATNLIKEMNLVN